MQTCFWLFLDIRIFWASIYACRKVLLQYIYQKARITNWAKYWVVRIKRLCTRVTLLHVLILFTIFPIYKKKTELWWNTPMNAQYHFANTIASPVKLYNQINRPHIIIIIIIKIVYTNYDSFRKTITPIG